MRGFQLKIDIGICDREGLCRGWEYIDNCPIFRMLTRVEELAPVTSIGVSGNGLCRGECIY